MLKRGRRSRRTKTGLPEGQQAGREHEEVRFLRKYLGLTGEEFSRLIHVDKSTLSKWENNEDRVGDQSDRLIRLIALGLGEGLKEQSERVIRSFPQIKDKPHPVGIHMNAASLSYQYA